jgi:hypothetical protein
MLLFATYQIIGAVILGIIVIFAIRFFTTPPEE